MSYVVRKMKICPNLQSNESIDRSAITLRALVAVADEGSFRRAAERLGYTQSAISHQIATLERGLGASLFHRPGGRGAVTLTAAGEVAYHHARRSLAALATLDAEVRAAQRGERETLRIGVFQTAAAELVPAALRELRERHPGVQVALVDCEHREQVAAALTSGSLDVAYAVEPEPHDAIEATPLLADSWVILTWRGSPLVDAERPDARPARRRGRRRLERALADAGRGRGALAPARDRAARRVPHGRQRRAAAACGGAARPRLRRAADRASTRSTPALTSVAPREVMPTRTIALCHARGRRLTAVTRAFIEIAREQSAA